MGWACSARAVVAMQLAAWSLAGVLLLHRGLSTLAKDSKQHALALQEKLANQIRGSYGAVDSGVDNGTLWAGSDNSTLRADNTTLPDYDLDYDAAAGNSSEAGANTTSADTGSLPTRKMRPTALVYVALGLLVLAVGPAIVAFKSCDERVRPAFQKVATEPPEEVEAPPSYESAVGEPAPRYSSLFGSQVHLDLLAPPPPPTPPPPPPPPVPPDTSDAADSSALLGDTPSHCDVIIYRKDS